MGCSLLNREKGVTMMMQSSLPIQHNVGTGEQVRGRKVEPLAQALWDELRPGEQVLWTGRPQRNLILKPSDGIMFPYHLLLGGLAIVWGMSVIYDYRTGFFIPFAILFMSIGLYRMFGHLLVNAHVRANTCYALTNERVIIVSAPFRRRVTSLRLKTLSDIHVDVTNNGRGTIIFGPKPHIYFDGWRLDVQHHNSPSFDMIDNAEDVYDKICEAQKRARQNHFDRKE